VVPGVERAKGGVSDPDLSRVVDACGGLPDAIKRAVLALVGSVGQEAILYALCRDPVVFTLSDGVVLVSDQANGTSVFAKALLAHHGKPIRPAQRSDGVRIGSTWRGTAARCSRPRQGTGHELNPVSWRVSTSRRTSGQGRLVSPC
jgi:hypothetical protein